MKRGDPRAITFFLAFLVAYLFITGSLILVLRGILLNDRIEDGVRLADRERVLDETMRVRALQEREIVTGLMAMPGASDFEDAYVRLRAELDELRERYRIIEADATRERDARLALSRERDDVVARSQALSLEVSRLEANLLACLDRLSSCDSC